MRVTRQLLAAFAHLRSSSTALLLSIAVIALSAACGGDKVPEPAGQRVEGSRIVLSTANLDSELSSSVVPASGEMPSPVGDEVLIYDWSKLSGFGGKPGEGNTIVGGSRATVFKTLDEVDAGDVFTLKWDGRELGYSVSSVCFWDSRKGNFEAVVTATGDETLTLLTSYGPTDNVELGRLVVTAKPRTLVVAAADCPTGLVPLANIDFVPAR